MRQKVQSWRIAFAVGWGVFLSSFAVAGPDATTWMLADSWSPSQDELAAYRALQAERRGYERRLKTLRATYFRGVRNTETRQIGMRLLRAFDDPAAFELLAELFIPEGEDVRDAVLDHFAGQQTGEGDAALAWEAVYGEDEASRKAALERLGSVASVRGVDPLVVDVTRSGLRESATQPAVAAANVAASLKLFDLIPLVAAAQVAAQGDGERRGDLGWILIGTQRTFVADVQPVVSDNAVAFDPQLAVISEGTLLRVSDAFVAVYRVEIHRTLIGMTGEAWGQSTAHLGYDAGAWKAWYANEFVPFLEAKAEAKTELEREDGAQP
ncbi:MAG: hypothetical protein AAF297_04175 [Planctomycetota bacterium]